MDSGVIFNVYTKLREGFDAAAQSPASLQERTYEVVNSILGIRQDLISGEVLAQYTEIIDASSSGIRARGEWARVRDTVLEWDDGQCVVFVRRLLAFRECLETTHDRLKLAEADRELSERLAQRSEKGG